MSDEQKDREDEGEGVSPLAGNSEPMTEEEVDEENEPTAEKEL